MNVNKKRMIVKGCIFPKTSSLKKSGKCSVSPDISSFYSEGHVEKISPRVGKRKTPRFFRTSISSFTLVGSTNRSWWLKPNHLKKYDRPIGSSLQVGRGENEKTTLKPPFSKWFQCFLCFVIHFLATKNTYSFNQR